VADTSRKLTAKFDGDTTGLAAAAKRGDKIVKDFGDEAGKSMGSSFQKGFDRDGKRGFTSAALSGANAFAETLTQGFRNLEGPAKLALTAGLVVAMPAVGAIAAGALVFAFGAGLIGLALAVTAKTPQVKAAFDRLIRPIGEQIKQIAKPFEQVWIEIMTGAANAFATFKPALESAFAALAPVTAIFSGQLFDALEQLAPVIGPIVEAFAAMAASLGPELPGIIANIAAGIIAIAESVEENPDALTDFFGGLGEIVRLSLELIAALNDMNGAIEDLTGGISGVDVVMRAVLAPIALLIAAVMSATGVLNAMKRSWDAIKSIFSTKHTADIEADDSGFRRVLKSVSLAAGAWDRSSFVSALTTSALGFYNVLREAYKAAGGWRGSTFKSALGATTIGVQTALDAADAIGRAWNSRIFKATFTAVSPVGAILDRLPGRAAGGPVSAGQAYQVGERGPEVFVPNQSGRIVPNQDLGGVGVAEIHIEIGGEVVRVVRTEIKADKRQTRRAVGAGALRGAPA
jgi:hypothetical protein